MRNSLRLGAVLAVVSAGAMAQSVESPAVKVGDTWTYRMTTEKGPNGWTQARDDITVSRVSQSTIFFDVKQTGSTQAPREIFAGNDWSRSRDVGGKETVVNRPFQFPMSQGKSWELSFTDGSPGNKNHKSEKFDTRYSVVGWEMIEVPAGKYRALKIEAEGHWQAELAPGQTVMQGAQSNAGGTTMATEVKNVAAGETSGRLYKAYWYVPEIKRWVKSVEEDYSSGGVRNERFTQELESFKAAD